MENIKTSIQVDFDQYQFAYKINRFTEDSSLSCSTLSPPTP